MRNASTPLTAARPHRLPERLLPILLLLLLLSLPDSLSS